jgi:hypothetical protein
MEWLVGAVAVGCWVLLLMPAVVAPLLDAEALEPAPDPTPLPVVTLPAPDQTAADEERAAA